MSAVCSPLTDVTTTTVAELHTGIDGHPHEVADVRHILRDGLVWWNIDIEIRDIAVLLTSEIVTNGLRHGRPPLRVHAFYKGSGLRVEVHDTDGDETLIIRPVDIESEGGRGLQLVELLATRWGWSPSRYGKFVWFEIDMNTAE
jgi:hypothetical protein